MNKQTNLKHFVQVVRLSHPHIVWLWSCYGFFTAILPFLSLYFSSLILNALLQQQYEQATILVLWMGGSTLICSLISKYCFQEIELIRQTATQELDQKLLEKAMLMQYSQLEQQKTMDTLRRTRNSAKGSGDIGSAIQVASKCAVSLFQIVFAIIILILLLAKLQTVDRYLFLFLLLLVIFLKIKQVFAKLHGVYLEELCNNNDRTNAKTAYLWDLFYFMKMAKEIRLYQMTSLFERKLVEIEQESAYHAYSCKNGTLVFISQVFGQVMSFGAYVYVASLALRKLITIGDVLYISGAIMQAVTAIAQLQVDYAQLLHQCSYLNSFHEFLHSANMSYDGTLPIEKRDDGAYEFEFRHVSFHYPDHDELVLHDVNLHFHLKETMALVGRNGSGKTTIVKLLCRLYEPTEGEILLNGINIMKYDYEEYTRIFSVVFQDFKLLSYELSEVIAGSTAVEKERLWMALEKAHMLENVSSLPKQENTLLFHDNGDGVSVSGGEAQKLAIARAFYKDAPFVILDEPTAALDPIAEAEVYEQFHQMVKDKTTLYISHRMSSCQFCDRILVLEEGTIKEEGTHQELLKLGNLYASLWNAQAQYYVNT